MKVLAHIGMVCLWFVLAYQVTTLLLSLTVYYDDRSFFRDAASEAFMVIELVYDCMPFGILLAFGILVTKALKNQGSGRWDYFNLFTAGGSFLIAFVLQYTDCKTTTLSHLWGIPSIIWFSIGLMMLVAMMKSLVSNSLCLVRWVLAVIPTFYLMTNYAGIPFFLQRTLCIIFLLAALLQTRSLISQLITEHS